MEVNTKRHQMHKKRNQAAFYTADQAHEIVGRDAISRRSFYNALERHDIPSIRMGRRILIPKHAFEQWIASAGLPAPIAPVAGNLR